ncbi:bifunctional DNA primase/polymerase [Methylobacterium isbiliense]|jgi:hypothetical protein|nr:bifunctional DNA primase/polymerase [Methylobacterium isbiliense]MDN3624480.1 bifunctional DNA primase/polymerase [Methylobacterium isbiliense]
MRYGIKIFPCRECDTQAGKAKSPYTRNGYKDAGAELHLLSFWSCAYPNAIYGIPCAENNIFVLDADRHGAGDGVQSLLSIFAHYSFDWRTVPVIKTPRDGLHVIFSRQSSLRRTRNKLTSVIDVRDNGYIIAPGSILPDGRVYQLLHGTVGQLACAIANRNLLPVPRWLIELVARPEPAEQCSRIPLRPQGVRRSLDGLISKILNSAVGNRNSILHWAACRGGELVVQQMITAYEVENRLIQAGRQVGLDDREVKNTVASGMRKGMQGH